MPHRAAADEDGADGGIPAAGDAAGAPAAATGTAEPAGGARQARRRRAGRLGDDQAGDAAAAGGDPNAAAGAGADPAQAAAAQAAAAAAAAAAAPPGLGILPQEVAKVVPYGTLGAEARMAATGEPPEVPPTTPVHLRKRRAGRGAQKAGQGSVGDAQTEAKECGRGRAGVAVRLDTAPRLPATCVHRTQFLRSSAPAVCSAGRRRCTAGRRLPRRR